MISKLLRYWPSGVLFLVGLAVQFMPDVKSWKLSTILFALAGLWVLLALFWRKVKLFLATVGSRLVALGDKGLTDQSPVKLTEQTNELQSLKDRQAKDMRQYIHPVLVGIKMFPKEPDRKYVDVTVAFASQLLADLEVVGLKGKLVIHGAMPIKIESFDNMPKRLLSLAVSSTITESVKLDDDAIEVLRKQWERTPMKLTLKLMTRDGQDINFDPPDDAPLKLSMNWTYESLDPKPDRPRAWRRY